MSGFCAMLVFTVRGTDMFVDTILNPSGPCSALRQAARDERTAFPRSGTGQGGRSQSPLSTRHSSSIRSFTSSYRSDTPQSKLWRPPCGLRCTRANPYPGKCGFLAGKRFLLYRSRGGVRHSPLPDFYIGAQAAIGDLALLTRDAARRRSFFPKIEILASTECQM